MLTSMTAVIGKIDPKRLTIATVFAIAGALLLAIILHFGIGSPFRSYPGISEMPNIPRGSTTAPVRRYTTPENNYHQNHWM
jgi:hypothetical protein